MKTYLFVDGSNLYAGQYDLFGPKKYLNFERFVKELEKNMDLVFNKIYFYASYSPRPKIISKKVGLYLNNEALFYRSCQKVKKLVFIKGHRSLTSGKEKGVDVALASDLVRYSCERKFKHGYLLTGDADFQRAVDIAKKKNRMMKIISIEGREAYRLSMSYQTTICWFEKRPKMYSRSVKFYKFDTNLALEI